jgi:hypothetical protein
MPCKILDHIGIDFQAPRITQARGSPLWDECDAPLDEGVQALPNQIPWGIKARVLKMCWRAQGMPYTESGG